MVNKDQLEYWAIIPAAGVGMRMQTNIPKQYLPLAGKTVLEQTLSIFMQHSLIKGIVVSISENDAYWDDILSSIKSGSKKPILVASGGQERKDSVLSALLFLQHHINKNAWVLVHDAARPCLLCSDINKLISEVKNNPNGGLLALPVSDTLKRAAKKPKNNYPQVDTQVETHVEKTISRERIWRALTPQLFKLYDLIKALEIFQHKNITDESSAIELLGLKPLLIEADAANIKITHPADLVQAELFFSLKLAKEKL